MILIPKHDEEYKENLSKFEYVFNLPNKKSLGISKNINGYKIHKNSCPMLRPPYIGSFVKWLGNNLDELKEEILNNFSEFKSEYSEYFNNKLFCKYCFKNIMPENYISQKKNYFINKPFIYNKKEEQNQSDIIISDEKISFLAKKLIDIYNNEKIPYGIKNCYTPLGFTKEKLKDDINTFLRLLIIVLYDQYGFTQRGWEPIWGLGSGELLPDILKEFMQYEKLKNMSDSDIQQKLTQLSFNKRKGRLLNYGRKNYLAAFIYIKRNIEQLWQFSKEIKDENDVKKLHKYLDDIPCVGKTIASKFIMYVFREININNNSPKIFKGLGYYLIPEYHNNKIIKSFGL
ncbi:MAG: hypothetical protein N3E50_08785, partial [Candidatus Goldbacteria bacterium]|nr:hypothetical protein [Candidatus Goldiibacteriota bacterium]